MFRNFESPPDSRRPNGDRRSTFHTRTLSSGVTSEPDCYLALCARCMWNEAHFPVWGMNGAIMLKMLGVTVQSSVAMDLYTPALSLI